MGVVVMKVCGVSVRAVGYFVVFFYKINFVLNGSHVKGYVAI